MRSAFVLFALTLLMMGCGDKRAQVAPESYEFSQPVQTGLPYDKNSKNIAALFTMTNESGRIENIQMMESIFEDGKLGFKSQRHHDVSSPYIYEKVTELSKEVGQHGTLLLYFNSHGGGSGSNFGMTADGGSFKLSKAVDAVAKGGKVKRLIVLIDTCHASGGIQEGFNGNEQKINPKTGLPELAGFYNYGSAEAYEECLVIASSSVEHLSTRGAFAARLKKAYKAAIDENLSVSDFMQRFAALHSDTTQKPHYKCLPDERMLDEPLFSNALIRDIPIIDRNETQGQYPPDYIPVPVSK